MAEEATLSDERDERLRSLLRKWSPSSLAEESDMNTKLLHLDPGEAERQMEGLRALRRSLDAAGRMEQATEYKTLANAQFAKEAWRIALVGYLAGVWMLRNDASDPSCPKLLANHLTELDGVVSALGGPAAGSEHASAAAVAEEAAAAIASGAVAAGAAALRKSLLVNLAAAALKLNEWRIARAACQVVLTSEPTHVKALWRLAKAYEGDGNLTDAMTVTSRLVEVDAGNKEASRLLELLQRRKAKHGKMFGSIVERAHAEGDTLYTKKEHEADVSDAMHRGFLQCMGKPMPGEEEEEPPAPAGEEEEDAAPSGDQERVTEGEYMESLAREHAMKKLAKGPPSEDMQKMNKVMGRAYMETRAMREEAVKASLPPNVLASYVDD